VFVKFRVLQQVLIEDMLYNLSVVLAKLLGKAHQQT